MGKMIYISEQGDDKNDGLTPETPVLTGPRAIKISIKEKRQTFYITGSDAYTTRMNEEIENRKKRKPKRFFAWFFSH